MSAPVYITFRHMTPRAELEEYAREQAGQLDRFCPRIIDCRVLLEPTDAGVLRAAVEVAVPGERLVASFESEPERVTVPDADRPVVPQARWLHALHEVFDSTRRMLETYAGRRASRRRRRGALSTAVVVVAALSGVAPSAQQPPVAMPAARVTLAGTSNVHNYSAWTDTVRVTQVRVSLSPSAETLWDDVLRPGALERFDIEIPVGTLTSRDAGLDKNMWKALKADANRYIVFRLARLEQGPTGALMAVGTLGIAGVEREVVMPLRTERRDDTLVVKGRLPLLMTDYGITPPTAMLGMLKTDPKVTVTFEVILSGPGTT